MLDDSEERRPSATARDAAIEGVIKLLSAGDHVVSEENTYGGTTRMFNHVLSRFGIEFTYVDSRDLDAVAAGQPLLRIDARDLAAKSSRAEAMQAEAGAVLREAELHAERMRALYADEAAPKVQLDAAETGLARARAGV